MRDTSFVVAPIRDHAFFEQPQLKGLFGNHFLQIACLTAQTLDLGRGRCTRGVTGKAFLASFKELLGPAVVQALGNAFTAAQLCNAVLALQAVQRACDLRTWRKAWVDRIPFDISRQQSRFDRSRGTACRLV